MKKLLSVLLLISVFILSGCSAQEEQPPDWKDYFQISYKHIDESKFDTDYEIVDAILNGTFVYEADEYTITNKTNEVLESVYLVFEITPTFAASQSFQVEEYVGKLKQGETKVETILKTRWEIEMENKGFEADDFYNVDLVDIRFKIKD